MATISRRLFLITTAAASLAPATAFAHHGWSGYDTDKSFTVTGQILESSYANPHCEISMQVEGKLWHFVLAPPSRMGRRGVTEEMIAPGRTCTVFGYQHMTKPDEARIEYMIIDGTRYELR
jgi:hypothetical protein